MHLTCLEIKNFRSLSDTTVPDCGKFNVLIGRNNSGKSNVLLAIDAFFKCVRNQNIVYLDPPIGHLIDFTNRNQFPISITMYFELELAERDELLRNIATESPQVKNAVNGLDPNLRLAVSITITTVPSYAYVSRLDLVHPTGSIARSLLSVGKDSAYEIYNRLSRTRTLKKDADTLQKIAADDDIKSFLKYSKTQAEKSPGSYYFRRLGDVSPAVMKTIDNSIKEVDSAEDLVSQLSNYAQSNLREIEVMQSEPLKNKIGTFAGEEPIVPAYVGALLKALSELKVLYVKERRKEIGREEAERLLQLKTRRGGPERLRSIQETVEALLGIKIDAFESEPRSNQRLERAAELDADNFLIEVNGSGIREALRLILDLEFQTPDVLLVEEPEVHLHPALEKTVMRFLKKISEKTQVFITTHSTNFLDSAHSNNVYLVSKPETTVIRHLVGPRELETAIPPALGIRLSSLFMFDRLVFIEGPSDESILLEWASILKVNLSAANVGFVQMSGARNISYYAADSTISLLTKRQVKIWFLIDRDEKDNEDIARLVRSLGPGVNVRVLDRREIDNYLVSPKAIGAFIALKAKLGKDGKPVESMDIKESKVIQDLEECANELKQLVVDKKVARAVCKPMYPNTREIFGNSESPQVAEKMVLEIDRMIEELNIRRKNIDSLYQKESEALNQIWQDKKYKVVPGDLLLDAVCRRHGVRYKKDSDGQRLASLMSESEIPDEIKSILKEIGD